MQIFHDFSEIFPYIAVHCFGSMSYNDPYYGNMYIPIIYYHTPPPIGPTMSLGNLQLSLMLQSKTAGPQGLLPERRNLF